MTCLPIIRARWIILGIALLLGVGAVVGAQRTLATYETLNPLLIRDIDAYAELFLPKLKAALDASSGPRGPGIDRAQEQWDFKSRYYRSQLAADRRASAISLAAAPARFREHARLFQHGIDLRIADSHANLAAIDAHTTPFQRHRSDGTTAIAVYCTTDAEWMRKYDTQEAWLAAALASAAEYERVLGNTLAKYTPKAASYYRRDVNQTPCS